MDDVCIPKKVMDRHSGEERPVGKSSGRWQDAVDLLQVQNSKVAERNRKG
jgi:hypothetical protein